MGTRHLTIIKHGKRIHAQYGQWDGYPEGQGLIVWEFVKKHLDVAKLKRQLAKAKYLSEEELRARWVECGASPDPKITSVTMDVGQVHAKRYPLLDRDCGAECLKLIQDSEGPPELQPSEIQFAASSLFCEFAWMLDLDKRTLEVFQGFNKQPLPEDAFFKYLEPPEPGDAYYPVREWVTIPFAKLKKMDKKEFLAAFPKDPEEVEEGESVAEDSAP